MQLTKVLGSVILLAGILNINPAVAATRINFAKGSYCGVYSGNFSGGREFVLGLAKGQTFTSKNVGGGTQYDVYVKGPKGMVRGEKVASNQINYYLPKSGNYYIYVESDMPYNTIEFCAY